MFLNISVCMHIYRHAQMHSHMCSHMWVHTHKMGCILQKSCKNMSEKVISRGLFRVRTPFITQVRDGGVIVCAAQLPGGYVNFTDREKEGVTVSRNFIS